MTIQVKLFGDLRKKAHQKEVFGGAPIILRIDASKTNTVSDILKTLNIKESEVSHIFVNGKYSGFRKNVRRTDLVALFPRNMGLLYKWYFNRDEDG